MFKVALLISASLVATSVEAQAPPPSQGPVAPDSDQLQTIMVTATKEATPLQTTPIAITAVTSEQLAQRNIEDTADLGSIIPNAAFRQAQGAYGPGVTAFIRGIGQSDTSPASQPGVAFYIDDVYYPLVMGSMFDLLDLDHVEVLRGPQGTLFGRNALAGAVSLVGKSPELGTASAFGEVTSGAYDRLDERGGLNLPLGDTLALRITAASKYRQGYEQTLDFRCQMIANGTPQLAGTFPSSGGFAIGSPNDSGNCTTGHLGGEDSHSARAQLLFEPSSDLKLFVSGDWTQSNSEDVADQLLAVNPSVSNANTNVRTLGNYYTAPGGTPFAYDGRFVTGSPYASYASYCDPLAAGTVVPGNKFFNGDATHGGLCYPSTTPLTSWGASSKLIYDINDSLELTAISGYRELNTTFSFDVTDSPLPIENTLNNTAESDLNSEIRLAGKSSLVDWVGGLFFFRGHGYVHATVVSSFLDAQRYQNNDYQSKSEAGYFNVNIRPIDRLTVTLGGRYSHDVNPVRYSNIEDGVPTGDIIFKVTPEDSRFDWKAGASYQVTDATMAYTSVATGYRLPTFNARPEQPDQVESVPGDQTLAYELGIKTDVLDHKLRFNGAVFYTLYKERPLGVSGEEYLLGPNGAPVPGQQLTVPLPSAGAGATSCITLTPAQIAAGTPGYQCIGRTYYINTPGDIRGVEGEVEAHPFPHVSIDGSMGFSHFSSASLYAPGIVNHELTGIPQWTASGGAQYEAPLPAIRGTLTPRLDWFYQGSIVYSQTSATWNQGGYSTFNGRLTYYSTDHDFSISAGATNLLDKLYYRNFFIYQALGYPNVNAQPAPPREWFVSVRKDF